MRERRPVWLLLAVGVLSACAPVSPMPIDSTGLPGTAGPVSTVALPAEHTPTQPSGPTATLPPTPSLPEHDLRAGLLEGVDLSGIELDGLTRYWIDLEVEFEPGRDHAEMEGIAHIEYTNTTGQALYDFALRLWPNDPQYASEMETGPVVVDGRTIEGELSQGGTLLMVPFSLPLEAGDTLAVDVPFRLEVTSFHGADPRRLGISGSVLIAPTFYPMVPRWTEQGWETKAAPPGGDTTNSDVALYLVNIIKPRSLKLAASGVEIDRMTTGELEQISIAAGPMRDFAFALGPFNEQTREVQGATLRAWILEEHAHEAETVLSATSDQFQLLSDLVGPYPYSELDVVDVPGAFGGIEYPGLVFIGTIGSPWVVEPIVHEVAHQWFYGLIGGDQLQEPWLDEGAATFATALYYEAQKGSGFAAGYLSDLRAVVRDHPNAAQPIGLPVGEYSDTDEYTVIVYFKGALFFEALRQQMGERTFEAFLQEYFRAYRFGFVDAEGFQTVAEGVCSCDLQALFDLWVYEGGELPGITD